MSHFGPKKRYGNLFAKDVLWMFRNPTRAQRFPVLLVRDAEDGNLLARWQIGASMVFESASEVAFQAHLNGCLSHPDVRFVCFFCPTFQSVCCYLQHVGVRVRVKTFYFWL